MRVSRQLLGGLAAALVAFSSFACDELPPAPVAGATAAPPTTAATAAASQLVPGSEATRAFADAALKAAETYASRCIVLDSWDQPSHDLCTHVDHCDAAVRLNFDKGPCGFSAAERQAPVDYGKQASARLRAVEQADGAGASDLAAFLTHLALFGDWVLSTTDTTQCLKRTPFGTSYCYEKTRGTLAMYQELAQSYRRYRSDTEVLLVPLVYHAHYGAPPFTPYTEEQRRSGLPWGRCPGGKCLLFSGKQQTFGGW